MQKGANEKGSLCCLGHKETQWGSDWAAFYHSASLSQTQIHTSSKNKLLLNYSCVKLTSKHTQKKFHFTALSHTHSHTLRSPQSPPTPTSCLGWQIFAFLILKQHEWRKQDGGKPHVSHNERHSVPHCMWEKKLQAEKSLLWAHVRSTLLWCLQFTN